MKKLPPLCLYLYEYNNFVPTLWYHFNTIYIFIINKLKINKIRY